MKPILYGTPTCSFCNKAREFLKELKVDYEYIDLSQSKELIQEIVQEIGSISVPALKVNNRYILGFNKVEYKAALQA